MLGLLKDTTKLNHNFKRVRGITKLEYFFHHNCLLFTANWDPLCKLSFNLIFEYHSEICGENQIPLKSEKHVGYFIKSILAFIIISRQFFLK